MLNVLILQVNPDYKGVCHVALAQEGHCRPGEVYIVSESAPLVKKLFKFANYTQILIFHKS